MKIPRNNKEKIFTFYVTNKPINMVELYSISKKDFDLYTQFNSKLTKKKYLPEMKSVFEQLIKKNPHVPMFLHNYNSLIYGLTHDEELTRKNIAQELTLFPNYLFGRIQSARYAMYDNEPIDKVLQFFDGKMLLPDLYPERDTFHESEAKNFHGFLAELFFRNKEADKALMHAKFALRFDKKNKHLKSIIDWCEFITVMDQFREAEKIKRNNYEKNKRIKKISKI